MMTYGATTFFFATAALAHTDQTDMRVIDMEAYADYLTYPFVTTADVSLDDHYPFYTGNNQAEACPMKLKKRCARKGADDDDVLTRGCAEEFYCEFPPTDWFNSNSVWNEDQQTLDPVTRTQIIQRALGWVALGFEYKWQGDESGSRNPLMGIESCYEGQANCPGLRYGSLITDNEGPDCCAFASMAWNIRDASCLRKDSWSIRIDCDDLLPGDAVSSGGDSYNDAPAVFNGAAEDTFPDGAHIFIFREWRDQATGDWTVYQLGGGWGKTNQQADEPYGYASWGYYRPDNMYCLRRKELVEDFHYKFTKDSGDNSCFSHDLMSKQECMQFAQDSNIPFWKTSTNTAVPKGCYLYDDGTDNNYGFWWGEDDRQGDCSSTRTCFCKPEIEAMIASSSDPTTCDGAEPMTQDECEYYALQKGVEFAGISNCDGGASCVPRGCYLYSNNGKYYWNDFGTDECTDTRKCVCKNDVSLYDVVSDDGTSGDCTEDRVLLTKEQCGAYALEQGKHFGGAGTSSVAPKGCYLFNDEEYWWTDNEDTDCTDYRTCVCRKPEPVENYAVDTDGTQCDASNALTEDQCNTLANQLNLPFSGTTGCSADNCAPPGCYLYNGNSLYWNDEKIGDCTVQRTCLCDNSQRRLEGHLSAPRRPSNGRL